MNKFIVFGIIKETIKILFKVTIGLGKAIWRSTLSILSLIVYSFLLYALIAYYALDTSSIKSFMDLTISLIDYWELFWWIFFASNVYDEWRWRK